MKNQKMNDTQVLVGQPINYPTELMSVIKNIFDNEMSIQKAYLACIQYPDPKLSPKILIGLEVNGDIERIISDILIRIQNYDVNQLEFTDVTNGPFKNYFSNIDPFYRRML